MTREEVMIDNRVHSMIIGRKGTGIRKIQQEFGVEIKLPREGDPNPDMVIVSIPFIADYSKIFCSDE